MKNKLFIIGKNITNSNNSDEIDGGQIIFTRGNRTKYLSEDAQNSKRKIRSL